MLVSRNVFLVVSALQCFVCLNTLIRSLVDPTFAAEAGGGGRGGGGALLPLMACTRRLRLKEVPVSGFKYIKGYMLRYIKR